MRYLNLIVLVSIFGMMGCHYNKDISEPINSSSISAVEAEFRVNVDISEKGLVLDSKKTLVLDNFLNEYNLRGRGVLTISLSNKNNITRQSLMRILQTKGIEPKRVVFKLSENINSSQSDVALRFSGYLLKVPYCTNWSGTNDFNPNNLSNSNFGCSYNRNIGLMLSDPGDIVDPEIYAGDDPSRAPRVLKLFRGGQPTGVSSPAGEKSSASSSQ